MITKAIRPQKLESKSLQIPCPCGRIYVHVTFDANGCPFEVFARLGKSGGCGAAVTNAMTTVASIALRSGADPLDIAKGLIGVSCHRPFVFDGKRKITSCADAIGAALQELIPKKED
jgi:ribonucleoside-diphosphate reductase alpha chain